MRISTVILVAFVTFLLVPGCGKAEKKAKKKSSMKQKQEASTGEKSPAPKENIMPEEIVHRGKTLAEWIARLEDEDERVRIEAADALEELGPRAEGAAPALVKALGDEWVKERAMEALIAMGEGAAPHLIQALKYDGVKHDAVEVLVKMGPPVAPELAKALNTENRSMGIFVQMALERIGPEHAIPELLDVLEKGNLMTRIQVSNLVVKCGERAVPGLVAMLETKNNSLTYAVAGALEKIGEKAVPDLMKAMEHEKPAVRANAASALGRMGARAKPAVPVLKKAMKDPDRQVASQARIALRKIEGK